MRKLIILFLLLIFILTSFACSSKTSADINAIFLRLDAIEAELELIKQTSEPQTEEEIAPEITPTPISEIADSTLPDILTLPFLFDLLAEDYIMPFPEETLQEARILTNKDAEFSVFLNYNIPFSKDDYEAVLKSFKDLYGEDINVQNDGSRAFIANDIISYNIEVLDQDTFVLITSQDIDIRSAMVEPNKMYFNETHFMLPDFITFDDIPGYAYESVKIGYPPSLTIEINGLENNKAIKIFEHYDTILSGYLHYGSELDPDGFGEVFATSDSDMSIHVMFSTEDNLGCIEVTLSY